MRSLILSALCSLLSVASLSAQTVGQWELRKRTSTGMQSYGITAENGKAIGFSGGVPAMLSISGGGGSGLDNIASSITGGTLTLAGTLTTGRTLTVRDLAGTIALTSDLSAYLTTSSAASTYEPLLTAGTTGQYYRGDKSWQTLNATAVGLGNVSNALQLVAANNLSDLTNTTTARSNLGLGTLATQNGTISDYLTAATAASTYQPLNAKLTAFGSLASAAGVLTDNGSGTFSYTATSNGGAGSADSGKVAVFDAAGVLRVTSTSGTSAGFVVNTSNDATSYLAISSTYIQRVFDLLKSTTIQFATPSGTGFQSRSITIPATNGTLITTGDTGTVTPTMLSGSIPASKLVGTDIATVGTITSGTWQGSIIGPAYLGTGSSISTKYLRGDGTWQTIAGGGDALTTNPLSQFAATTSSQFAGVISDETGTGAVVLASSPTLTTPNLGTPSAVTLTNATGLPLSTGVTGTLPIANGGTGQTSQTAAFDALAPTTTKGDIIVSNGTDNIRVPVGGTNGHVLTVDSAEASGVKWAAASGGGGSSFTPIQTLKTDTFSTTSRDGTWADVTGLSATITPATGKKVLVEVFLSCGGAASGGVSFRVTCNGTVITEGDASSGKVQIAGCATITQAYLISSASYSHLHSPASNGSTAFTYQVQISGAFGAAYTSWINRSSTDPATYGTRGVSMIRVTAVD